MINEKEVILVQRIKEYGLDNCLLPEKPLEQMTINELRNYASALRWSSYVQMVYNNSSSYKKKNEFEENMNKEFKRRMTNAGLWDIYAWIKSISISEYDNEDYEILVRQCKPYDKGTYFLKSIEIKSFIDKYKIPFEEFTKFYNVVKNDCYYSGHTDVHDNSKESPQEIKLNNLIDTNL